MVLILLVSGFSHAGKAGVDRLISFQDHEQRKAIAEWLSSSDFPAQQNQFFRACQEGTGKCLLDSNEYRLWLDGSEPTLFCPGIPGAGKTMLTSIVVSDLQERFRADSDVGIVYVYCNYKRQSEPPVDCLMASLCKQLLQGRRTLPTELNSPYQRHAHRDTQPSTEEIRIAMCALVGDLSRTYLVVDALDECAEVARSRLLKDKSMLQADRKVSLITTSRYIPDMTAFFGGKLSLEIRTTDGDVPNYLKGHMVELLTCVKRNPSLQEIIALRITEVANGM